MVSIAKREDGSRIVGGNDMIEINAESIREMPNEVDFAQMDEDIITEPYQDVEIHIRAKDIDRNKMGWAGVIAE